MNSGGNPGVSAANPYPFSGVRGLEGMGRGLEGYPRVLKPLGVGTLVYIIVVFKASIKVRARPQG